MASLHLSEHPSSEEVASARRALRRVRAVVVSLAAAVGQPPVARFPELAACPYIDRLLISATASHISQRMVISAALYLRSVVA